MSRWQVLAHQVLLLNLGHRLFQHGHLVAVKVLLGRDSEGKRHRVPVRIVSAFEFRLLFVVLVQALDEA